MHHYWVGTAATLHGAGHPTADRILEWIGDGEVLASGHGEVGNDVPVFLSTTRAERVVGGWRIHGRKQFGSLGPVWDRLGIHAMDTSDPVNPVIVHGFLRRDTPGVKVVETWDAHGMRATESHDTVIDGAFLPDEDVLCVVTAGPTTEPAVGVMMAWALTLISNVYVGIAERALEIAIADATRKTSIAIPAGTMAHHPLVQQQVAAIHLELHATRATADRLAADWVGGVDHGPAWPLHILGTKWRCATSAMRVVDLACEVVGGASYRRGHELERLSRDVRAARFHPGTDAYTHEVIGKALSGHQPRRAPLVDATDRCEPAGFGGRRLRRRWRPRRELPHVPEPGGPARSGALSRCWREPPSGRSGAMTSGGWHHPLGVDDGPHGRDDLEAATAPNPSFRHREAQHSRW